MNAQEAAEILDVAEDAALNVGALLTLLEDAAWTIVNNTTAGKEVTMDDVDRVSSVHTAIMIARKQFSICYEGISEGQRFAAISAGALEREAE